MKFLADYEKAAKLLSSLFPPDSIVGEVDFDILDEVERIGEVNYGTYDFCYPDDHLHYVSSFIISARNFERIFDLYLKPEFECMAHDVFLQGNVFRYQILPTHNKEYTECATIVKVNHEFLRVPVRFTETDGGNFVRVVAEILLTKRI